MNVLRLPGRRSRVDSTRTNSNDRRTTRCHLRPNRREANAAASRAGKALRASGDSEAQARASETEVDARDLEEAKGELEGKAEEAKTLAGGQQDDPAYYPRDPILGLLQSSLQRVWINNEDLIVKPAGQALMPADVAITDIHLKAGALTTNEQGFARACEQTDVRWASCWLARLVRAFKHKHPFNADPAPPFRIGNRAMVIVVGDWGTGVPRARQVGAAMREVLTSAADRERHVIHLGDVYYSGWKHEYDQGFLPFWPVRPGEADAISSWALNSNYDMFSGAWDYFDYLLAQPQFRRQKRSSFFSLENDYWQILGLDSAYEPYDLFGLQANWVKEPRNAASNKKGILLTHHQLFSAFEEGSPMMEEKLKPVLDAGLVRAWLWGHEHRCIVYEPRDKGSWGNYRIGITGEGIPTVTRGV